MLDKLRRECHSLRIQRGKRRHISLDCRRRLGFGRRIRRWRFRPAFRRCERQEQRRISRRSGLAARSIPCQPIRHFYAPRLRIGKRRGCEFRLDRCVTVAETRREGSILARSGVHRGSHLSKRSAKNASSQSRGWIQTTETTKLSELCFACRPRAKVNLPVGRPASGAHARLQ